MCWCTALNTQVLHLALNVRTAGVLVHCGAGVSRSATLCMMYLMRRNLWTATRAKQLCIERRSLVCPNDGFWRALCALEASIGVADRCGGLCHPNALNCPIAGFWCHMRLDDEHWGGRQGGGGLVCMCALETSIGVADRGEEAWCALCALEASIGVAGRWGGG